VLSVPRANVYLGYNNYEQTSYTSYGAGGGAGGGGFIPGDGSQQSPGGRREHTQDSLRPVTIKQLLDAQLEPSQYLRCVKANLPTLYVLTMPSAHICRTNT
jgi:hypothetical protein